MSPLYSEKDIEEIRNRVDLAEVVSEYVRLKRAGRRLKGLCPFHTEKTPSFFVDPEKQLYHCFGCGAGGDVFSFVMEMEKMQFSEAVEHLAARIGYQLTRVTGKKTEGKQRLYDLMELSARLFQSHLWKSEEGKKAIEYLKGRGFSEKTIKEFEIGLAPSAGASLTNKLLKEGYTKKELIQTGMSLERDGRVFDRFRGRIMFPIRDIKGRVVAFGGRQFSSGEPKYLNSPETPLFKKSSTLYNLYNARQEIIKNDRVLVVEGYTDVIALWQEGVTYTVATLGTALTTEHLQMLKRFTQNIYLAFDADAAGRKAAERGIDLIQAVGNSKVQVVFFPEGTDPADFVKEHSGSEVEELLASSRPLEDFVIDFRLSRFNLTDTREVSRAAEEAADVIARIADPVIFDEYLRSTASRLGITEDALRQKISAKMRYNKQTEKKSSPEVKIQKAPEHEEKLFRLIFQNFEEFAEKAAAELEPEHFSDDILRSVFEILKSTGGFASSSDFLKYLRKVGDENTVRRAAALAVSDEETEDTQSKKVFAELVHYLKLDALKREIRSLRQQLVEAERAKDYKRARELLARVQELTAQKGQLSLKNIN